MTNQIYGTIRAREFSVYFVESRTMTTCPAVFELWHKIGLVGDNSHLINRGATRECGIVQVHGSFPIRVACSVAATFTDEVVIACPKVRRGMPTRWNGVDGRWEKLTARHGWVAA